MTLVSFSTDESAFAITHKVILRRHEQKDLWFFASANDIFAIQFWSAFFLFGKRKCIPFSSFTQIERIFSWANKKPVENGNWIMWEANLCVVYCIMKHIFSAQSAMVLRRRKKMLAPWIIHEKYGEHIWWDKNHKFEAQLSFYFDKCYIHIRCLKSDIFVVALLSHLSNRRHHQTSTTWRICFNISSCSHYYIANRMHWSHTTEVVLFFFCFRDEVQWGEAITFDSNANYSKFCTL